MFSVFRRRRRARLRDVPLPESWRAILSRNVPLHAQLPPASRRELEGHLQVLLAEKHFEGAGGLELTDEVRVTVAAHAALLLLGREPERVDYFPGLVTVLVYPSAYRAPTTEDRGGIVSEGDEARLGESWHRGVVVLAWDAARAGARNARDGDNVILHEFAHQLDTADGAADGVPPLDGRSQYAAWARALAPEYARLREHARSSVPDSSAPDSTVPDSSALDRYGAESPAEFFAVATEAFFEKPRQTRERHPELYAELSRFYRLDPASHALPNDDSGTPSAGERDTR